MKKNVLSFILSLTVVIAYSQSVVTSTVQWNSDKVFNAVAGQWSIESTYLITTPSNITWKSNDDSIRKTYQIIEAIGEWNDVRNDGRIQFEVTDGQNSGTITIFREGTESKAIITMASDSPDIREIHIQEVQVL